MESAGLRTAKLKEATTVETQLKSGRKKRSRGEKKSTESEDSGSGNAEESPTATVNVSVEEPRKRKRKNGKAVAAETESPSTAASVDDDFEEVPKETRKRKEKAPASSSSEHLHLFDTIKSNGKLIPQAVKQWVEEYEEDPKTAVIELLLMFFEACGVRYKFDAVPLEEINVDDVVVALVRHAENGEIEDCRNAKPKEYKAFKENLLLFWDNLVVECQDGPLFDQVLFEKCMDYVIAMSCTPPRVFRHVATLVGLQLVASFITIAKTLGRLRETTQRQLNAEKKKRSAVPLLESLNKRLSSAHERITMIEEMMRKIFTGLFMHRYRDIDAEIRMACIGSLGAWILSYPSLFLQDLYLKYLGWTLNDKSASVRRTSVLALQNLYEVDGNIPSLVLFTERFSNRIIELADDIDVSVAVSAIGLVKQLLRHQLITDDELGPLYDLLIDENTVIRHAVGELVYDHLIAQKFSSSQSSKSASEAKSPEVHLGRLLQILQEFSADPILSSYVIDDLWDNMDAMKDWKCITSMLLNENPKTELTDTDAASLAWLLCASIKKAVGEQIVVSNDNKRYNLSKVQKELMENNRHEMTIALMKSYPQILQKFVADKAKVKPLVDIVLHLKLELYSLKRKEQNFHTILQLIGDAFFKHVEKHILRSCVKAMSHCAAECRAELQVSAQNKLKELEDELLSKLSFSIKEIAVGDDEYSLLVNLRRLLELQLVKSVTNEGLFDDLAAVLKDYNDLGEQVVSLLLLNMYMLVLWCYQSIDVQNPSGGSISSLLSKRSTLFSNLHGFLDSLVNINEEGQTKPFLSSTVCVILVDLWCLFNEVKFASSSFHLLGYCPDLSTVQKFWKLCEQRLTVPDAEDEESADDSFDETNQKDTVVTAAAKLVIHNVVSMDFLGPEIISHFALHGPHVAEVVKRLISVLKKSSSSQVPVLFLEALTRVYQRHEVELSKGEDEQSAAKTFLEVKDLATRLSGTFVGAARNKHKPLILAIVKKGVEYSFEDAPKRLSFLEGAVLPFMSKLPAADAIDILRDVRKRAEGINTDEDPSGWRPYYTFVDTLAKIEGLQGKEGHGQRRRGRKRKADTVQGRKLFDDQSSSGEEDSISGSDQDNQDEEEEEYRTPLKDSLKALKLTRSLASRSGSKLQDSSKATLDNVLAS